MGYPIQSIQVKLVYIIIMNSHRDLIARLCAQVDRTQSPQVLQGFSLYWYTVAQGHIRTSPLILSIVLQVYFLSREGLPLSPFI